jgi:hypothetical protein
VQPAPEITQDTKLLSIDVESNGLHGAAFAVGAVLVNGRGEVLDEFVGRSPIEGEVDKWVTKNVLPAVNELPENYDSATKMREAFWTWYKAAKDQADYVLVDNGYPVEARFLINCQDEDLDNRYWDHPFPLLDLSSMLLQVAVKPQAVRHLLVADELGERVVQQHNPSFDAYVSALATLKAWRLSGRLK